MSAIQHILDKAAREGTLHSLHAVDAVVAAGATPIEADVVVTRPAVAAARAISILPEPATVRVVPTTGLDPRLVASTRGALGEQYRAVRTRIAHADRQSVHTVLVTSPGRAEGKSLTVANLGLAMAQDPQRRLCIVDADLRSPRIHRLFGIPGGPGLSDVLVGDASLDDVLVRTEKCGITFLPAGDAPGHPAELLGTAAMRQLLDTLRSQYDRVLIDAPGAAPLADVGILTPLVDSVVLVVRAGRTSRPAIHEAIASIEREKLLGIVLNEAV